MTDHLSIEDLEAAEAALRAQEARDGDFEGSFVPFYGEDDAR